MPNRCTICHDKRLEEINFEIRKGTSTVQVERKFPGLSRPGIDRHKKNHIAEIIRAKRLERTGRRVEKLEAQVARSEKVKRPGADVAIEGEILLVAIPQTLDEEITAVSALVEKIQRLVETCRNEVLLPQLVKAYRDTREELRKLREKLPGANAGPDPLTLDVWQELRTRILGTLDRFPEAQDALALDFARVLGSDPAA